MAHKTTTRNACMHPSLGTTYRSLAVTGILVPPLKNPTMPSFVVVVAGRRVVAPEKACATVAHSIIVAPIDSRSRRPVVTRIMTNTVVVFVGILV